MNPYKKAFIGTALLIVFSSCVSKPPTFNSKYFFPELELVRDISGFSLSSWQSVDRQSMLIQTAPQTHYLLVLNRRSSDIKFAESIQLIYTGNGIRVAFHCEIETICSGRIAPTNVIAIYKLGSVDDIAKVKRQIRGE